MNVVVRSLAEGTSLSTILLPVVNFCHPRRHFSLEYCDVTTSTAQLINMASGGSSAPTTKLQDKDAGKPDSAAQSKPVEKAPALLEEDDEFEDFPVEGD